VNKKSARSRSNTQILEYPKKGGIGKKIKRMRGRREGPHRWRFRGKVNSHNKKKDVRRRGYGDPIEPEGEII